MVDCFCFMKKWTSCSSTDAKYIKISSSPRTHYSQWLITHEAPVGEAHLHYQCGRAIIIHMKLEIKYQRQLVIPYSNFLLTVNLSHFCPSLEFLLPPVTLLYGINLVSLLAQMKLSIQQSCNNNTFNHEVHLE